MPIKVLHIVQTLETGGLENGVINIANLIDQKVFQYDILCLRGRGELEKRLTSSTCRVFYDASAKKTPLGGIFTVQSLCKKNSYEIIHTHGFATMLPGYIGGKLAGVPAIINGEHGTLYFDKWRRRITQRILFNLVTINLTVSQNLKHEISKRFRVSEKKFHPIINGVDTAKFHPSSVANYSKRREFNIPTDCFVIGSVGRLVAIKDYPTLIKSFSLLSQEYENVQLVLVGDGDQSTRLKQITRDLNLSERVRFLGHQNKIPELLNMFDLFVLPSIKEGLSNTILEAMACGKPVLATRTGGNSEIVDEGKTGYLFDVGDTRGLSELMRTMINDNKLRARLSENARIKTTGELSIASMIQKYENVYRRFSVK